MAIILDDKINSAPVIESRIGARGRITLGGFGDPFQLQQEAKDLVAVLRSGALPAPLHEDVRDPGRPDAWAATRSSKAKLSMDIGAAAVILFMLIYYRLSGLIANIAMILNMLYMLAILAGFEASLTLPGIAGLVLTVGMAVDANIIIYERIREELRAGQIGAHRGRRRLRARVLDGVRRARDQLRRRRRPLLLRLRPDPRLRGDACWSASSPTCSPRTGCRTGCSTRSSDAGAPPSATLSI